MREIGLALLFITGAAGTGHSILRRLCVSWDNRIEEVCFSLAIGFGVLQLCVLTLGLSHLLYAPILWGVTGVWAVVGFREIVTSYTRRLDASI